MDAPRHEALAVKVSGRRHRGQGVEAIDGLEHVPHELGGASALAPSGQARGEANEGLGGALVGAGLRRLRAGQGCAGLRALIEVSGRDAASLGTTDIGYAIGPRINAAGRLEDMGIGIECLLADDIGRARALAAVLHAINQERRGVQQQMTEEAETALQQAAGDPSPAVSLFDPDWHPGVVGLVASKLKERLHRPAIAFAPVEPGSAMLRGSARSIPGFHVRDALALVDARHPRTTGH